MAKMKALLPAALILGGAYILPPAAFAQTLHDNTIVKPLSNAVIPNAKTFDALLAVPTLITTDEDANRALKEMGLDKSGEGAFSWSESSAHNGKHTFQNVYTKNKNDTLRIESMTFSGLRMDGNDPTFERLDLRGIHTDEKKEGALTLERVSMSRPSPEVVKWVVEFFDDPSNLSHDVNDYEPQLDAFGAFYLSNLKLISRKESIESHVAALGWGTARNEKSTILIRDASISGEGEEEAYPVDINIGLLIATGLDMDTFQKGMDSIDFSDFSGSMGKQNKITLEQNPFSKKYDLIQIADFSIKTDSAKLYLEDLTASQQKTGSKLSSQLTLKPFSFGFSKAPTDPELLEAYENLVKIGFDNIRLSGTSQSMIDEATDSFAGTSHFDLVDLMSIGSDYSGNGFGDFMTAIRRVENTDDITDEEAMEALGKLSLDSMTLSLRDVSMIDKILSIAAKETDQTPDMLKTKAKSLLMMGAFMAQNPSQMALASEASSAFTKLIDEGGEVTIKIQPGTPLTMGSFLEMDMDNPKNIDVSELGVSIEYKK